MNRCFYLLRNTKTTRRIFYDYTSSSVVVGMYNELPGIHAVHAEIKKNPVNIKSVPKPSTDKERSVSAGCMIANLG